MLFNIIGFTAAVFVLTIVTVLGFWKETWATLFMGAAGIAMILGLNTPRLLSPSGTATDISVTIGLSLVAYALLMLAMAFKVTMWQGDDEDG